MEALILMPVALCVLAFCYTLAQDAANQSHRRRLEATRFKPDDLGNYPAYFDPRTGSYSASEPGNPAYPITYTIVNNDNTSRRAMPNYRAPIKVNNYLEPTLPDDNEPEPSELVSGSNQCEPDEMLKQLKGKVSKNEAFRQIGISKGSSPAYTELSRLWNELPNNP